MHYKNILVQNSDQICYLTINRPKYLNSLNNETINELSSCIKEIIQNKEIKCVILTGAEKKAFVAGADIKEFSDYNKIQAKDLSKNGHEKLFNLIENSTIPFIAAVNGFALGGGLELAMSCHIRIASDNAKMGLPEVSLGVIPGYGGTQRLPQIVGKGLALEMITTAKMINAEKALSIGLVNQVCDQKDLIAKCVEMANKIKRNSSTAITNAIKSVNACYQDGVDGMESEINFFSDCFETKDFVEGTKAFMEKRKPKFN